MKKKSKWNGLEEHYKVATGPKTSTRYNIFGLVARANGTRVNGDPTVFLAAYLRFVFDNSFCGLMPHMYVQ